MSPNNAIVYASSPCASSPCASSSFADRWYPAPVTIAPAAKIAISWPTDPILLNFINTSPRTGNTGVAPKPYGAAQQRCDHEATRAQIDRERFAAQTLQD